MSRLQLTSNCVVDIAIDSSRLFKAVQGPNQSRQDPRAAKVLELTKEIAWGANQDSCTHTGLPGHSLSELCDDL